MGDDKVLPSWSRREQQLYDIFVRKRLYDIFVRFPAERNVAAPQADRPIR
jgi:hypothetical protein